MSRRPQSFHAYAGRRWRVWGFIAVLLAGSLLVVILTDRGHDPLWSARGVPAAQVALAPNGEAAYVLVENDAGVVAIEARRGENGALIWTSELNATRALVRAGDGWVAVATDFPRAFLTLYSGADGSVRFQVPLEGNPRAMAAEGDQLALGLQGHGNPVLLFGPEGLEEVRRFPSLVNALDYRAGRLAVGTGAGEIFVFDAGGDRVHEASFPLNVRSARLSGDGLRLVVGGFSLQAGALSGRVLMFDFEESPALRWTVETAAGIGFVDIDDAGLVATAMEESPPRSRLRVLDVGRGEEWWSRVVEGEVAQDDSGDYGGVALSPDAQFVIVGTKRGAVQAFDARTGAQRWSYGTTGVTGVAFARDAPDTFLANGRLALSGPSDALLLFSAREEPVQGRLVVVGAALIVVAMMTAFAVLGFGYWRRRRPY